MYPEHLSSDRKAYAGHIAPFAVFVLLLALEHAVDLPPQVFYPIRFLVVAAVVFALSRPYLSLRPSKAWGSVFIGAAVFVVWIAPDLLFHYRGSWLFDNPVVGHPTGTMPERLRHNAMFLAIRVCGATLLVPILEELFWRSFLMRWLVQPRFWELPFGTYAAGAFWITALLFGSEHGSYWEVGMLAGIAYNWWAVRTHCLADCILAHAVTNGLLSAYVITAGQWQYWP